MEAAGWQCAACSIDDVSRRVQWAGEAWAGEGAYPHAQTEAAPWRV